jgi:RNA polymerase-binding transcription factor DksA
VADFDRKQVDERLAQREREIEERRAALRAGGRPEGDALADYDQHPGDQGTETYMQEMDDTTELILDEEVGRVKEARQALEDGRYGVCVDCGKEIPKERLEAVPESTRCVEDQRAHEARLRQGGGPAATH